MARDSVRTAQQDEVFFTALSNCHSVGDACVAASYSRAAVYLWRGQNEEFRKAWAEAKLICADLLEEEADRRGRDGYDQPVFFGGQQVGTKRKYSDALLLARLKAERPEKYNDRVAEAAPAAPRQVTVHIRDFDQEDFLFRLVTEGKLTRADLPERLQAHFDRENEGRGNPGSKADPLSTA